MVRVKILDWGPYYDSSTGEDCTDNGGEIIWRDEYNDYRYAPTRRMSFATINSRSTTDLRIFSLSITSNCNGVDVNIGYSLMQRIPNCTRDGF